MINKLNKKNIIITLAVILLVMQFFTIDKTRKAADPSKDFITLTQPSEELTNILRTACYDCHSVETKYPWYTSVAPISWWIAHHIDEGSEHLNFSAWGDYSPKKQDHKLEEFYEEVEEGEMPLFSYTLVHGEAQLSDDQREKLISWVKELRKQYSISE